jgi:hypothetical protein
MLTSASSHTISWLKPDLDEEFREFFQHPAKQAFYGRHAITWERILGAFEQGCLVPYPRSDRIAGVPVELAYHRYEDYEKYLAKAKRGYRLNYSRMESALQRAGSLSLPAPIILAHAGEALLFSGYRRLCLAWNYGMVPQAWLVKLT